MEIVLVIVGLGAGFFMGWLVTRSKTAQMVPRNEYEMRQQEIATLQAEKAGIEQKVAAAERSIAESKQMLDEAHKNILDFTAENSQLKNQLQNLDEKLTTQKQEIETLQQRLAKEFENLANRIFEEKSEKFARQNRDSLDILINPLKEKMDEFKKKVEETHHENTKESTRLTEQIRQLTELNQGMREDANRLTQALKGESKTQGNWGELILERILEKSGLTRGQEYTIQESFTNEDGRRLQPDVIIKLPENKNLIIDSKVSLTAYERIYASALAEDQQSWLKAHVKSVRDHIKMLSDKRYHQIYSINTPDFVLMFIPIESAFAVAVQSDPEIFNDAFDRNIVLVTTSTLLATLRTISGIWKQEYQNRNVMEIAKLGGSLHDKFVSLVEDLVKVGKQIDAAKDTYQEAMKKLYTGNMNVVRQTHRLKELGAKTSKVINPELLERSDPLSE